MPPSGRSQQGPGEVSSVTHVCICSSRGPVENIIKSKHVWRWRKPFHEPRQNGTVHSLKPCLHPQTSAQKVHCILQLFFRENAPLGSLQFLFFFFSPQFYLPERNTNIKKGWSQTFDPLQWSNGLGVRQCRIPRSVLGSSLQQQPLLHWFAN